MLECLELVNVKLYFVLAYLYPTKLPFFSSVSRISKGLGQPGARGPSNGVRLDMGAGKYGYEIKKQTGADIWTTYLASRWVVPCYYPRMRFQLIKNRDLSFSQLFRK